METCFVAVEETCVVAIEEADAFANEKTCDYGNVGTNLISHQAASSVLTVKETYRRSTKYAIDVLLRICFRPTDWNLEHERSNKNSFHVQWRIFVQSTHWNSQLQAFDVQRRSQKVLCLWLGHVLPHIPSYISIETQSIVQLQGVSFKTPRTPVLA
jgi:hypothetical protein